MYILITVLYFRKIKKFKLIFDDFILLKIKINISIFDIHIYTASYNRRQFAMLFRFARYSAAASSAALVLGQRPVGGRFLRSDRHFSTLTHCETNYKCSIDVYTDLKMKLREIDRLEGISALLSWDEAVLLPELAAEARNNQRAALAGVIFEKKTAPSLGNNISRLLQDDAFSESNYDRAILRDAARSYDVEIRKSKDLAMHIAKLEGRGYESWVKARSNNDWGIFVHVLEEVISAKKELTRLTKPNMSLYDGVIDDYERGMKSARIAELFMSLKVEIVSLISKILSSKAHQDYIVPDALKGGEQWDIAKQKELCREVALAMTFDFSRGRFDESVHPFTGGPHPSDVRITTRYSIENWLEGVSGTVHEVGHGLYEQGRNKYFYDLPVSRALSMGVHESQSLFWERMIFQSKDFWIWATPIFHKHFPHTKDCSADDFYRFVNRVSPGSIRVDADEVTYPLHIILRFDIEKAIFADNAVDVNLNGIPAQWDAAMKDSLSVNVPDAKMGPLQDVHWSFGAFGYFPSYTLGAIIAAQLYEAAEQNIPDLKGKIRSGDFGPIREYLRVNVHEIGSLYEDPDALIKQATGKEIDFRIFLNYLNTKYSSLYKLNE